MGLLAEILAFLAASPQNLGVPAVSLFQSTMPNAPDACGAVYEYGGPPPDLGFGVVGIQHEYPAFQVMFRGVPFDYNGPRAKAEVAYRALAALKPGTLSGTRYLIIHPQQSPFRFPKEGDTRVWIACNFIPTKELSVA